MIRQHYSEADLLETYYMQPGESMPVMMHLADCSDCAARYERLERKLRDAAACDATAKPETFWTRQRMSIMRRVETKQHESWSRPRVFRAAAAALLAFLLGGGIVYETAVKHETTTASRATTAPAAPPFASSDEESPVAHDPWQSDELQEFHAVVQWESWVAESAPSMESEL